MANEELDTQNVEEIDEHGEPTVEPVVQPVAKPRQRVDLSQAPPEALPFIEAARTQEKTKLYSDMANLRKSLRETQEQLANIQREREDNPPKTKRGKEAADEEINDLKTELRSIRDMITERDRKVELRAYRAQKLAELRADGVGVVESVVQGKSEEEIDLSIELAKAEFAQVEQEVLARNPEPTPQPQPKRTPARPVVVKQTTGSPEGVARPVNPGAASEDAETMTVAELRRLTSMESIRSGDFKKNKDRIHAALRRGTVTQ